MKNVCVMPLASPSVSISHLERCVWSIEAQDSVEFDHDIVVVVNSLDDEYTSQVKDTFSEYDVFDTASNSEHSKRT